LNKKLSLCIDLLLPIEYFEGR